MTLGELLNSIAKPEFAGEHYLEYTLHEDELNTDIEVLIGIKLLQDSGQ